MSSGPQISVTGGAGGVSARYDDMLLQAKMFDVVAHDFGSLSSALARVNVSDDLLEAAALCPADVARVEEALLAAIAGPRGATSAWASAEARAAFLRFAVEAYRDVDATMAKVTDDAEFSLGLTAGLAASTEAAMALGNPLVPALASLAWTQRKRLGTDAQSVLYDDPWLQEVLTRVFPGFFQGAASGLTAFNPALMAVASGGNWPSSDFASSVRGLVVLGRLFGKFQDSGSFRAEPRTGQTPVRLTEEHFLSTVMDQQVALSDSRATVQISQIMGPSGPSYIVQIPGTQDWSPSRGNNPIDLTSNLNLVAGGRTVIAEAVVDAMRNAHIPTNAPVMLAGHSQGGIVAAAIAADPQYRNEFHITSVLTAGSPISRMPLPDDVVVLSLEEKQDIIPKLDGVDNPDRANWITVKRDLTEGEDIDPGRNLAAAHSVANYAQTASFADASTDPSLVGWRKQNVNFFGSGTTTQYTITDLDEKH